MYTLAYERNCQGTESVRSISAAGWESTRKKREEFKRDRTCVVRKYPSSDANSRSASAPAASDTWD